MESAPTESPFLGFRMNRLTSYCGCFVRHGGWYPDTKLRLWSGPGALDRRESSRPAGIGGRIRFAGHLQGDLLHYSYRTVEDHQRQIAYFLTSPQERIPGQHGSPYLNSSRKRRIPMDENVGFGAVGGMENRLDHCALECVCNDGKVLKIAHLRCVACWLSRRTTIKRVGVQNRRHWRCGRDTAIAGF